MEKVYGNCCGVDVHKKIIVACLKRGRTQEVQEFGATTRELLEMAQRLTEGGCEAVAMENVPDHTGNRYITFWKCQN